MFKIFFYGFLVIVLISSLNLNINNFTFTRARIPVYAIREKDAKCFYFQSLGKAQQTTGVDKALISRCINGNCMAAGGYTFCRANELEKITSDGKIEIDNEKLANIYERFYQTTNTPVYVINRDRSLERHSIKNDCLKSEELSGATLPNEFTSSYTAGGKVIVKAKDIEKISPEGKIVVDEEKLNHFYGYFEKGMTSNEIYLVKEDKTAKKYSNKKEAAKAIGAGYSSIGACLFGRMKTIKGHAVVRASEIETTDENGNLQIDQKKLDELVKESFTKKKPNKKKNSDKRVKNEAFNLPAQEVCLIAKDTEPVKYASKYAAVNDLSISSDIIKYCYEGSPLIVNNGVLYLTRELEKADDDGNVELDYEKISKILESKDESFTPPCLAIGNDGYLRRYESYDEAKQNEGDFCYKIISESIDKVICKIEGPVIVREKKVVRIRSGVPELDSSKANLEIRRAIYNKIRKAIYSLDKNGEYKRYKDIDTASEETGISLQHITNCAQGVSKTTGDLAFIRARKVEKLLDDNTVEIDLRVLRALKNRFNS